MDLVHCRSSKIEHKASSSPSEKIFLLSDREQNKARHSLSSKSGVRKKSNKCMMMTMTKKKLGRVCFFITQNEEFSDKVVLSFF